MTIKELYEWAKHRKWEDFEIALPIPDVYVEGNEIIIDIDHRVRDLRPELGRGNSIDLHYPGDTYSENYKVNYDEESETVDLEV